MVLLELGNQLSCRLYVSNSRKLGSLVAASFSNVATALFTTLAYQLALHRHELKGPILLSVETDPSVLGRRMDVQLRTLILEPCHLAGRMSPSVLLIDGLDECDGHNIQREILHLIGSAADKHHLVLQILIPKTFKEESLQRVADSTNIGESFEDVQTYFRDEFSRIHQRCFRPLEMNELLGLEPGHVELILCPLHSVLEVGPHWIGVHYTSFLDFLKNKAQSSDFYVGFKEHREKLGQLIFKVLGCAVGDPHKNQGVLHCCPPSADLVTHIQSVNLDFIFHVHPSSCEWDLGLFLTWIKSRKEIEHVPEALIQHWEDYALACQYEVFQQKIWEDLHAERDRWCQEHDKDYLVAFQDGDIPDHILDYILPMNMMGEVPAIVTACRELLSQSPNLELDHLHPAALVSHDLACGLLRLLQRIGRGELPMILWGIFIYNFEYDCEWGHYIRSSPQSDPELLWNLNQFVPPWDVFSNSGNHLEPVEFYDVIKWLKEVNSHYPEVIPQPSTQLD
ncbi:hypothetical protein DFH08DRAFT_816568 [Mycena albidolilacea]|uniref:Nephrocystin 3-like N-terminal domain-containing protein n=1 Tax=Mycena albidolilacea TaxID=1033008 RepID=A0AAD7EIB5_9AGAR|nr:hypothetical protein DFH08DRAFT_816568 [Mycena albidolilacea]